MTTLLFGAFLLVLYSWHLHALLRTQWGWYMAIVHSYSACNAQEIATEGRLVNFDSTLDAFVRWASDSLNRIGSSQDFRKESTEAFISPEKGIACYVSKTVVSLRAMTTNDLVRQCLMPALSRIKAICLPSSSFGMPFTRCNRLGGSSGLLAIRERENGRSFNSHTRT